MDERFFDAADGGPASLELRSIDGATFRVLRQIGYLDPHFDEPFVVPATLDTFATDLTSVPTPFLWLVSKVGPQLLPAVLHDGMVAEDGEKRSYLGPDVDRTQADRIFRDAMIHVGVGIVRSWLIWAAVALATIWVAVRPRWAARGGLLVTFVGIAALGVVATLDLVDVWDVLPWMGAAPWWQEAAFGILFAIAIPLAVSLLWRRRWSQVAIGGVALATLLHVTIAVLTVSAVYLAAERLLSRRRAVHGAA